METNFSMETKIYLNQGLSRDHVLKKWLAGDFDLSEVLFYDPSEGGRIEVQGNQQGRNEQDYVSVQAIFVYKKIPITKRKKLVGYEIAYRFENLQNP